MRKDEVPVNVKHLTEIQDITIRQKKRIEFLENEIKVLEDKIFNLTNKKEQSKC